MISAQQKIIIVGGGLAGQVTALMLARHGHAVTLMDAAPTLAQPVADAEAIRTTTLNPCLWPARADPRHHRPHGNAADTHSLYRSER